MATFLLHYTCSLPQNPNKKTNHFFINHKKLKNLSTHCSIANNGAVETSKPIRRGRKKKSTSEEKKTQADNGSIETKEVPEAVDKFGDYEEDMYYPYDDPPLICCFGSVQKEFVPTVRVHDNQMHPDMYSTWKMLQWDPPEFGRAPGGPASNVAISHVRLGGRAAFMGKIGGDEYGEELLLMMNKEKVQTRSVKIDESLKTARAYVKFKFEDGKMKADVVKSATENSLLASELNLSVLKEV